MNAAKWIDENRSTTSHEIQIPISIGELETEHDQTRILAIIKEILQLKTTSLSIEAQRVSKKKKSATLKKNAVLLTLLRL